MAENTAIEWCDHTFNPWVGCTKVSPACDHCYAERDTPVRILRAKGVETWGPQAIRHRTGKDNWHKPIQWQAKAAEFQALHGRRQRVFCASLADVFDNQVPVEWRRDLFDLIELTPDLDWLLLTKRIGNVSEMVRVAKSHDWLSGRRNVWLGATICNQAEADRDIPKLAAVRVGVRFLSMEPLLGPVDLRMVTKTWEPGRCDHCCNGDRCDDPSHYDRKRCPHCHGTGGQPIGWVICGGESGPSARPMHPDWARSLRDQCAAAGAPFLFKQWGEWRPPVDDEPYDTSMGRAQPVPAFIVAPNGTVHCFHNGEWTRGGEAMLRVGKKSAGRLLDGIEHNGLPKPI